MSDYSRFQRLIVEVNDGVALVTLNRPEALNATDGRLHWELTQIWPALADDPDVRVAVVTGSGNRAFSAGGDLKDIESRLEADKRVVFEQMMQVMKEAAAIVYNMINCDKPIISAINGTAVGAGLAVALCADISIINENARLTDGHTRLGVAAGDHSAIIWPLLCGMAKAKYYLLTCEFIDGKEAERIGLVSMCKPAEAVLPTAMEVARKLADGPQFALQFTKRALNQWLRLGGVTAFDYSLALEMLNFFGGDLDAGVEALRSKQPPQFPSAQGMPTLKKMNSAGQE